MGIIISLGILKAQTIEIADSTFYTLGFSTYLSHTDKYALGFDTFSLEKIVFTEIKQPEF